jgi:phosphohistidine phosphatase
MEIYLLRHASAGEQKLSPAKDEKRELDELGIEQSHIVGRGLAAIKIKPDEIVSSPLARAAHTAAIVADEIGHVNKIVLDEALRPEAGYEQFEKLLARYSDREAVLFVGHNPSMTEFLSQLIDAGGNAMDFKKAAVARVDKEPGRAAMLKWMISPKLMRALQAASAKSSRPKTVSK